MNKLIKIFLFIMTMGVYEECFCQDTNSYKNNSDAISYVNSELFHKRTTIVDKQNYVSHGFLLGIKRDSLLLLLNNQTQSYCLDDLISISVDVGTKNYKGFLMGTMLGIYTCSLALLPKDEQPFAYLPDNESSQLVVLGLIFAFAGGGIGYLAEQSMNKDQMTFIFSNDESIREEELSKFKDFLFKLKKHNSFHIAAQLSQVSTRLSKIADTYYDYYGVTSFNLLRKLDITYDVWEKISAGIAINWFGEPKLLYSNSSVDNTYIWINQNYKGVGYYLVAAYEPFSTESFHAISWKVGLGLGIGQIDYKLRKVTETLIEFEFSTNEEINKINKSKLSVLFYSHFNVYLFENLSLGLSADYVYLNEKIPAIPELNLSRRDLGNYSIGANLSFHF